MQAAVILGAGRWWYGTQIAGGLVALVVVVAVGNLALLGLGMVLASFVRTVAAATPVTTIAGNAMMFLGGIWFPLENAPAWLQQVGAAIPATPLTDALRQVLVAGEGVAGLGSSLTMLALWAAVTIPLASWRFRSLRQPT